MQLALVRSHLMVSWLCACLLAVLPCSQGLESRSDPGREDHAELRDQVRTTLNGLLAPCAFDLWYSNLAFSVDSQVAITLQRSATIAPASNEAIRAEDVIAHLDRAGVDERDPAEVDALLRTPIQTFRVSVGRDRAAQWCTSDPAFYSVLRTAELEFLYFSEAKRLEIRKRTRGLRMFRPADLITPLPATTAQVDLFVAAVWQVQDLADGCSRILALQPDSARPWLRLDVGPAPDRLPYSCTWFDGQDASPGMFQTLIRWTAREGVATPAEILRSTHSAERVDIARYELRDIDYAVAGSDVWLPIARPERIEDSTGLTTSPIDRLEDLPDEWRALLLVVEPETTPREEPR